MKATNTRRKSEAGAKAGVARVLPCMPLFGVTVGSGAGARIDEKQAGRAKESTMAIGGVSDPISSQADVSSCSLVVAERLYRLLHPVAHSRLLQPHLQHWRLRGSYELALRPEQELLASDGLKGCSPAFVFALSLP